MLNTMSNFNVLRKITVVLLCTEYSVCVFGDDSSSSKIVYS